MSPAARRSSSSVIPTGPSTQIKSALVQTGRPVLADAARLRRRQRREGGGRSISRRRNDPLVFASSPSLSFGLSGRRGAKRRPVAVATRAAEPARGRLRSIQPTAGVGSRSRPRLRSRSRGLDVAGRAANDAGRRTVTGFVVLRRGGLTRRIPFWRGSSVPSSAARSRRSHTPGGTPGHTPWAGSRLAPTAIRTTPPASASRTTYPARSRCSASGSAHASRTSGSGSSAREGRRRRRRGSWQRVTRTASRRSRAPTRRQPVPRLVRGSRPVVGRAPAGARPLRRRLRHALARPSPARFSFRLWVNDTSRRARALARPSPEAQPVVLARRTEAQASIPRSSSRRIDGRRRRRRFHAAGGRRRYRRAVRRDGTRSSSRRPTTRRRRTPRAPPGSCRTPPSVRRRSAWLARYAGRASGARALRSSAGGRGRVATLCGELVLLGRDDAGAGNCDAGARGSTELAPRPLRDPRPLRSDQHRDGDSEQRDEHPAHGLILPAARTPSRTLTRALKPTARRCR